MPRRITTPALLIVAALLTASGAHAQAAPPARCAAIPDSLPGPTPQQIAERNELREQIQAVLRAHGQPVRGLLMVDVDSTRRGKVLFMEADLPDTTRRAAIAPVADYLATLAAGQGYQALIRIDGEYPAMTPGRLHCRPELANPDSLSGMMQAVLARHPEAGRHREAVAKRATVRMVVTRDGRVAYAEVERPTGDAFLDQNVEAIAMRLRFRPATLDGEPFDVRFRFNLTFNVR
ncbi:MAG: energy transducer TonB [Gemmatimonadetes bacterium]|nr:energy transducer TonB [Gemmatimonadota bacterium]